MVFILSLRREELIFAAAIASQIKVPVFLYQVVLDPEDRSPSISILGFVDHRQHRRTVGVFGRRRYV
jgi:hypothetical protein